MTIMDNPVSMQSLPGTYALILENRKSATVVIGRWGELVIEPGYYIYIGSAFGPGGVRARVARHCRRDKSKRWHIDYLREFAEPVVVWFTHEPQHLEHCWAQAMADVPGADPVSGFGCSDCRCNSHLFFTAAVPELDGFNRPVSDNIEAWVCRNDTSAANLPRQA